MKPLETIVTLTRQKAQEVDQWFDDQWQGLTPLPYFSCDIRHSQFKMGIVDTNLFPAGFNNLCKVFTQKTHDALTTYLNDNWPQAKTIALLGENHTRNKFYLQNLLRLQELISSTGRECLITLPLDSWDADQVTIPLAEDSKLTAFRPQSTSGQLSLNNKICDLILSNNDFTQGIPRDFQNLKTPICPDPRLGWHQRTKSAHFGILDQLIRKFCLHFNLEPWNFLADFTNATQVNENQLDAVTSSVQNILNQTQNHYTQQDISESPYVFIKNDSGTYGMGLVTVSQADEVLRLNRKSRQKLFSSKGGGQTENFLIQEGIPTADSYSGFPIEPVIYGIGKNPIGGFFRIHEGKNQFESLNSPGMSFSCLCLHKIDEPHESFFLRCEEKERLVNGAMFLARFAALAAAME